MAMATFIREEDDFFFLNHTHLHITIPIHKNAVKRRCIHDLLSQHGPRTLTVICTCRAFRTRRTYFWSGLAIVLMGLIPPHERLLTVSEKYLLREVLRSHDLLHS